LSIFQPMGLPQNPSQVALSEALKTLMNLFKDVTEFTATELKSIALLQSDKYFVELMQYFIAHRKDVKRKYAKEILEAIKLVSAGLSTQPAPSLLPVGSSLMPPTVRG